MIHTSGVSSVLIHRDGAVEVIKLFPKFIYNLNHNIKICFLIFAFENWRGLNLLYIQLTNGFIDRWPNLL